MLKSNLNGKTALITGAAKRLGRQIALALASEGVNILVHFNSSEDEAEELCMSIRAEGVKAWKIRADFESEAESKNLIKQAIELSGKIDILINNASIFPAGTLDSMEFNDVVHNMRINAWVPFVLTRSFHSMAGCGSVVNMLDTRIKGYDFKHAAYILSKHVLSVLTAMTAMEYAPDLRINAVAPGLVLPPPEETEAYLDRMKDFLPLKRHGGPEDVAEAVLFLLKSEFITGQTIYVDGGRNIRKYAVK